MGWHEFFFGPGDVVQAILPFLMAAGAGLSALSGILGHRSASKSRNQAMELQRQQLEAARQYQQQAQEEYASRDPMRQMFTQRLMGFQGAPGNAFAPGMFGQAPPPPPMEGGAMSPQGRPLGMGMPSPGPPGMMGANPYQQFSPQQNLLSSQIAPQWDRSALDQLRGILGTPNG